MPITKMMKMFRNTTRLELRPIVSEKRKLREVVRKRKEVSLYPYFHPPSFRIVRMLAS